MSIEVTGNSPGGTVIGQDPVETTGVRGQTIKVVLSRGPEPVDVPNVRSMLADEAGNVMVVAGDKGEAELSRLADALDAHIRFEERELFNEIQREVGEAGLARVEELHRDVPGAEDWPDEFWL